MKRKSNILRLKKNRDNYGTPVFHKYTSESGVEEVSAKQPEHRLISSMIYRAILDVYDPYLAEHERLDALAWICSPSEDMWSFFWCCGQIGLEKSRALHTRHDILDGKLVHNITLKKDKYLIGVKSIEQLILRLQTLQCTQPYPQQLNTSRPRRGTVKKRCRKSQQPKHGQAIL